MRLLNGVVGSVGSDMSGETLNPSNSVLRPGALPVVVVLSVVILAALRLLMPVCDEAFASAGEQSLTRAPRVISWIVAALVLSVALFMGSVVALYSVWRGYGDKKGTRALATATVALLSGLVYLAFEGHDLNESTSYARVFFSLLGPDAPELEALFRGARFFGAVGPAFVILILAGMTATSRVRGTYVDAEQLRTRGVLLRTLLYVSSVAMVAGVVATLYRLELQIDPRILAAEGAADGRQAIDLARRLQVAHTITVAYGAVYSLFLIVGFLPAALALRAAGWRIAAGRNPEDRRRWIKEQDLSSNAPRRAISALATLAPVLAAALEGPVGELLRSLAGG